MQSGFETRFTMDGVKPETGIMVYGHGGFHSICKAGLKPALLWTERNPKPASWFTGMVGFTHPTVAGC